MTRLATVLVVLSSVAPTVAAFFVAAMYDAASVQVSAVPLGCCWAIQNILTVVVLSAEHSTGNVTQGRAMMLAWAWLVWPLLGIVTVARWVALGSSGDE